MKQNKFPPRPYKNFKSETNSFYRRVIHRFEKLFLNRHFFAIGSALIIGLIFGAITLQIVNIDPTKRTIDEQPVSSEQVTTNESTTPLKDVSFYVIQVGVFSDIANASILEEQLDANNIANVIWEKENQYYLIAGMYTTSDAAKIESERLKRFEIDSFVKEWVVTFNDTHLNEHDSKWAEDFLDTWLSSLAIVDNDEHLSKESWLNLLEINETLSSSVNEYANFINNSIEQINFDNQLQVKSFLYLSIYEFESHIQNYNK